MSPPATPQTPSIARLLRWPALITISADALIFPIVDVAHRVPEGVAGAMTVVSAVFLTALFIRLLLDPACRRGIDAANKEMQGNRPFTLRWIPLFDPTWGVFGSRTGGGYLRLVRPLIFVEFLIALFGDGSGGAGWPLLLATAAFGITIMLTLIQLKDHYPSASGATRS